MKTPQQMLATPKAEESFQGGPGRAVSHLFAHALESAVIYSAGWPAVSENTSSGFSRPFEWP